MAEIQVPDSQQPEIDHGMMEVDALAPMDFSDKIEILKGYELNLSAATYCLHHEDHTIGNALRYMLMKNPDVEFCGYSAPHPSEPKIHIRIQMYNQKSSLVALREALDHLETLFQAIGDSYQQDLDAGAFEKTEQEGPTEEALRDMVQKGEAIKEQKKNQQAKNKGVRKD